MLLNFKKIVLILIFVPLFSFGTESNIIKHELDIVNQEDEKKYPCEDKNGQRYRCSLEEFKLQQDEHQKLINKSEEMEKEHMEKLEFEASLPKIEVDENGFANIYTKVQEKDISFTVREMEKNRSGYFGISLMEHPIKYYDPIVINIKNTMQMFQNKQIKKHGFKFPNGNIFPSNKEILDFEVFDEEDTREEYSINFNSEKTNAWGYLSFYKNGKYLTGRYVYKGFSYFIFVEDNNGYIWSFEDK